MNAGGVDLVGAWYELAATLLDGRPVDAASGWPILTTREAFEVAQSWGLLLSRLGETVEPFAWRWLDEAHVLLSESEGPDELLPSSSALWGAGAALLEHLATRNDDDPNEWSAGPWRNASGGSIRPFGGAWLIAEGFGDPIALWVGLRGYFVGLRPVRVARGWSYPETTNLDVSQAAMVLDVEIDARHVDEQLQPVLTRWREWKIEFRAHMKKDETRTRAVYPKNEAFWLDVSHQLAISLARAPKKAGGGGGVLGVVKDAAGWAWDHKRWLLPVPGLSAGLEVVTGGSPELADIVPGVDLVTGAADAITDGAKDVVKDVAKKAGGLFKPIAIGVGAVAGVALLAAVIRK